MPADAKNAGAGVGENLGDEKTEFSVPEDRSGLALSKRELLQDLERGSDAFAKNGGFVCDAVRNGVEVCDGDPDELGEGTVGIDDEGIRLEATDVNEGDKSPGAVFVDPLAALAEGRILDIIADAISTSLPAAHSASIAELEAQIAMEGLRGSQGALGAYGQMTLGTASNDTGKSRPKPKRTKPAK